MYTGPNTRPLIGTPAKSYSASTIHDGETRVDMRVGDSIYGTSVPQAALNHGLAKKHTDTMVHVMKADTCFEKVCLALRSAEIVEIMKLLPLEERLQIMDQVMVNSRTEMRQG